MLIIQVPTVTSPPGDVGRPQSDGHGRVEWKDGGLGLPDTRKLQGTQRLATTKFADWSEGALRDARLQFRALAGQPKP